MKTDRAVHWGLGIGAVMIVAAFLWQHFQPIPPTRNRYPLMTKKWEFTAGGMITGALALAGDGTIYAASKDGFVYALDGTGNLKWKLQAGPMEASPTIGIDGTIYVTDVQEHIYAINPDGTQQWATGGGPYARQNFGSMAAAIDQNFLYTPWRNEVHAIRLSNGDGDVTTGIDFQGGTTIAILPNGLVVHCGRGRLQAAESDGRIAWQYPQLTQEMIEKNGGFPPPGNFWIDSPMAVGRDGTIYVWSGDTPFVAIGADGTLKWEFKEKFRYNRAAPVVAADGTIYFGEATSLLALNPDGTKKWTTTVWGGIGGTPLLAEDGTIFVASGQSLFAVTPDGKVETEALAGGEVKPAATLAPDGTLYVATTSGKILAFDGGHGGLMDSPWPKFQHDLANTGRARPY